MSQNKPQAKNYTALSKYMLSKKIKKRGLKGSSKREVLIDRLIAHDQGHPVPLKKGTVVMLPSVSQHDPLPTTYNYKEESRPFFGITIHILKQMCMFLDPVSLCNFGKTCRLYYNNIFKPITAQKLYNTIFVAIKDEGKLVEKLNKLSKESFTPKALAFYMYRQNCYRGTKSKKGKEYSICVDLLSMLSSWKTVDVWLINQQAEKAEMNRDMERRKVEKMDRIDTINAIAISLGYIRPFEYDGWLKFTKKNITVELKQQLYIDTRYRYIDNYICWPDNPLDEKYCGYCLYTLFELGLIDKEIDELVPVLDPELEKNLLKRSRDDCPGCMLEICNIHDIHDIQPKKSKVDECLACELGLCYLHNM